MIPFHLIYTWLFKSFNISGESLLVERLIEEGYPKIMVIKRSWIFSLFIIWLPICVIMLSSLSVYIAYINIDILPIKYTLIAGNSLMSLILIISSLNYIRHFREIHKMAEIRTDTKDLLDELTKGDNYFKRFFDWSISNQVILFSVLILEAIFIVSYWGRVGDLVWILALDSLIIVIEIVLLKSYRKKMLDMEMDYNVVVPGKIFFVNQSGVLSSTQTLESQKIKTVRSNFPSKLASFFNFGNIDIMTEGDSMAMLGTLNMYYVTSPDDVVTSIQRLLDEEGFDPIKYKKSLESKLIPPTTLSSDTTPGKGRGTRGHTLKTREKIQDVLN